MYKPYTGHLRNKYMYVFERGYKIIPDDAYDSVSSSIWSMMS